jgi:hypothetical protein
LVTNIMLCSKELSTLLKRCATDQVEDQQQRSPAYRVAVLSNYILDREFAV